MYKAYTNGTDRWLTPPGLVDALGPFDMDPCCEPAMPWRTAKRMWSLPPTPDSVPWGLLGPMAAMSELRNGLTEQWEGRVWMNHPYSSGLHWALAMVAHNHGTALTSSKSLDTAWGQLFLQHCSLVLFLSGRILFHYPDGAPSSGKWLPNALWAFGEEDAERLSLLTKETDYRGTYMTRKP